MKSESKSPKMKIDIDLAWRRVKKDLNSKNFISPIFLQKILEHAPQQWTDFLKTKLESSEFVPHPMEIIEVPKGKGLIRPGSLLNIEDNIIYAGLVQECYEVILNHLVWSQETIDVAYVLSEENKTSQDWFKSQLIGWNNFREKSLEKISEGYQYVVTTDLTGFYDNIDIQTLITDLKTIKTNPQIVAELSKYLNKWAQIPGRGLPQSNSASDVLAKLYLNSVDLGLKNADFIHLRYVDDIRIFCRDIVEARKALIELTRLLRKRGLNLQSSKTKIIPAQTAKKEIGSLQPLIADVENKFLEEIMAFEKTSAYFDQEDLHEVKEEEPRIEIIKSTFQTYFIDDDGKNFDKTLLHYLLNRLISEKDSFAYDYCMSKLDSYPEETKYFLKYSKSFDEFELEVLYLPHFMTIKLTEFLLGSSSIYDYQNYQIINWIKDNTVNVPENLIKLIRNYAFDNNKPYYLRSVSRAILGKHGNHADHEKMEDALNYIHNDLERAELLCSLAFIEKGKRNALLSRYSADGDLTKLAVSYIKAI